MRDWQGATLTNKRGHPQAFRDESPATDLVFELMRDRLASDLGEHALDDQLMQGTYAELVQIWYRRRNCVGHGSECLCRDPSLEHLQAQPKFANCLRAFQEDSALGSGRYYDALREVCKLILFSELK